MHSTGIDQLRAEVRAIRAVRPMGRVTAVSRGVLSVAGLSSLAAQGDLVEIRHGRGAPIAGEVIGLEEGAVTVLPEGSTDGISIGDRVLLDGANEIAPDDSWIGRVIDPFGHALDGRPLLRGVEPRPLRAPPPSPTERPTLS